MMYKRIKITFLLLIIAQGIHSIDEYYGELWTVLMPARIVSGSISPNLKTGFIIINVGLIVFGVLCWLISTRHDKISYPGLIWIWIVIETINGIGHPLLALDEKSYFPGLFTALIPLVIAQYLATLLLRSSKIKETLAK